MQRLHQPMNFFRSHAPRPERLSAKGLLRYAAGLSVFFLAAHLAGLREFTSVLNGTVGSTAVSWEIAALLGVTYIAFYLAFVIVVPVLVAAAILLSLGKTFP